MNLRREDILEGRIEAAAIEADRQGLFRRMTPEEREKSKRSILAQLDRDADVWLFGYGSLMWNPIVHYAERQPAHVFGFHRKFCLWTAMGRGTPETPGLTLGLERGGSVRGIAFRLGRAVACSELDLVWGREMISNAYIPRLVRTHLSSGVVSAIAFTINRDNKRSAGDLTAEETASAIARAEGRIGRCSDYLEETVRHLDALGIADGPMHALLELVHRHLESSRTDSP
jgi:cation transport protein ChaC